MSSIRTIKELASGDTGSTDARGSSIGTKYALEPIQWLKEINDAAQKQLMFAQSIQQVIVDGNTKDVVIPYRTDYLATVEPSLGTGSGGTGGDWVVSETNAGAAITFTKLNNFDGVTITPIDRSAGIAIPNMVLRQNAIPLMDQAKRELTYHAGDEVDIQTAKILKAATASTSSARGAQTVYGGDATTDASLDSADTFDPDLIANAKTKLQSRKTKYWSGGTEANSSQDKPPWRNTPDDPFMLFISSEQENSLLKSSQFVNAAEYGGNEVVLNGEIGKFLGVKIIVTENTPKVASGGTAPDGGSAPSVDIARCMMIKPKAAAAIAWSIRPRLHVFDYQRELEKNFILEQAYEVATIHNDAVVHIDVTDI